MTQTLTFLWCFLFFTHLTKALFPNDLPEFKYMDLSADPCNDFYQYTCGNFAQLHQYATKNIVDQFSILEDELIDIGKDILTSCRNEPDAFWKAKQAYRACLTSDQENPELVTIEDVGGFPLISTSNESVQFSWPEIGDLVGKYGVPLLFSITVGQINQQQSVIRIGTDNLNNPSLFRPQFGQSYEEVLEEEFKKSAKRRVPRAATAPFDIFLQTLAKKLLRNSTKSEDQVLDELNNMANFMRKLYAGGILEPNVLFLESETTLGELQKWTDTQFGGNVQLNWTDYLNRVFQLSGVQINDNTVITHTGTNMLFGTLNLVHQTDPNIVKNFALLRIFLFQAPDSDQTTRQAFEDYYTALNNKIYPREEYCTRRILDVVDTASLSYAVTYIYHNRLRNIDKAQNMVTNIQNVFKQTLNTSTWMDAQSRQAALNKADNMLVLLGYPDFVQNATLLDSFYGNLKISQSNYENARHLRAFKQAYQLSQLGQPDRQFWGKSPFDSNAYYNRPNNKIVIPIALLNPSRSSLASHFNPVFFYGEDDVLDYSRLGAIIGHEMTHGFDGRGKDYDQDGMLQAWWSQATEDAYQARTQCFVDQYSQYEVPEIDANINGSYSVDENLADNGGVKLAYKAFKELTSNTDSGSKDGFSLSQQFFIGYGTMWCGLESNYALQVILSTPNGYSPKRFRVMGSLSNMPEFADAFNCPIGSTMNPEQKCSLW